jgi:hypothetical protein
MPTKGLLKLANFKTKGYTKLPQPPTFTAFLEITSKYHKAIQQQ